MRRKAGMLVPNEVTVLTAILDLSLRRKDPYGALIAKEVDDPILKATIYRVLDRLEASEIVRSRLEDPAIAEREDRPRRRFFEITPHGEQVLARTREEIIERKRREMSPKLMPNST